MSKNDIKRYSIVFVLVTVLLLAIFWFDISMGSADLSFGDILRILGGDQSDMAGYNIIWQIRLPRTLAAVVLGGALSVSGFMLQTFFGNSIVGPYVLGISSGAKLVVALTMIVSLANHHVVHSWEMVVAAFVGSMIAMGFVLCISVKVKNMSVLVVCGIMIGYICSAITDFVVTYADDSNIVNLHNWSLGSLSGIGWENVRVMAFVVAVAFAGSIFISKPIGAYQLGEAYARNMGVNITALRVALILISSVLAACVTAFAGPISFVGIAVPHLVRSMTKTGKPLVLLPGCFLAGAVVTLFCDGIVRVVFAPVEVSISSVTAVLLVPVVLYMMLRKRGGVNGEG